MKLRNITSKSFTQIMEIESMSQCIFTSEVNEGQSQRKDKEKERMQWHDPKDFQNEEEERNHLQAVINLACDVGNRTGCGIKYPLA